MCIFLFQQKNSQNGRNDYERMQTMVEAENLSLDSLYTPCHKGLHISKSDEYPLGWKDAHKKRGLNSLKIFRTVGLIQVDGYDNQIEWTLGSLKSHVQLMLWVSVADIPWSCSSADELLFSDIIVYLWQDTGWDKSRYPPQIWLSVIYLTRFICHPISGSAREDPKPEEFLCTFSGKSFVLIPSPTKIQSRLEE